MHIVFQFHKKRKAGNSIIKKHYTKKHGYYGSPTKRRNYQIDENTSVFSVPKDINGIKGSQGPRIKKMKRANGVHLEKVEVCDSTL